MFEEALKTKQKAFSESVLHLKDDELTKAWSSLFTSTACRMFLQTNILNGSSRKHLHVLLDDGCFSEHQENEFWCSTEAPPLSVTIDV